MTVLASLFDFALAQGQAELTGPEMIKSAGTSTDYLWPKFARGKPEGSLVRTMYGKDFREKFMLTDSSTLQTYTPYDPLTVSNPQNLREAIAPQVYAYDAYTWSDQEAEQNGQNADLTQAARSMMYANFLTAKKTYTQGSIFNGMETKFMARPDPATMEGASQTEPCSFFHLYNEFPNSLYVFNSVSMATKHQINPAAAGNTRFRNHIFGYDSSSVAPAAGAKNLLNALDTAANRLTYKAQSAGGAVRAPQNWEDSGWPTKMCFWSYTGLEKLLDLARQRNDTWTKVNELGMSTPVYRGIEQVAIPSLETAAVYPTDNYTANASPNTEGNTATINRGPRGYVIDMQGTHALFNRDHFFKWHPLVRPTNQFATIQYIDAWYQYMTTAPWLSGVIVPGVVSGTFPNYTLAAATPYSAY